MNNNKSGWHMKSLVLIAVTLALPPASAENLPPANPFFAHSPWAMIHGGAGNNKISLTPGPTVPSKVLTEDEITWKKLGPFEATPAAYSSPYPNGRRTIVTGTHQQIVKMDADTLETISTYSVRRGAYYSQDEIEQAISELDKLAAEGDRQALYGKAADYFVPALLDSHVLNIYGLLNNKNERLYFLTDLETDKRYLQFYGDAVENDFYSPITLIREWKIPEINGKPFIPFAANLTYDGWLVIVSNTGVLLAITQDFKQHHFLELAKEGAVSSDSMQSFVRNGIAVDDQGGVYVITRDFLARVQWTGKKLTMSPQQGAWKAAYPSGARGSGATPALMGWGDEEDHLIIIADGTDEDPHIMAFWRDDIPEDWQGLPGYDRRVAAVAQVSFIEGQKARARIENSPIVMGNGVFVAAETPSEPVPFQGSVLKQFVAEALSASLTGTEAVGGVKWVWNAETRKLELAWRTGRKLAQSICTPSVNGILYCIGRRNGNFTLEGINWLSGESAVHYTLGPSLRYFAYNPLVVAPNGAVDLLGWLNMGLVRINPKQGPDIH